MNEYTSRIRRKSIVLVFDQFLGLRLFPECTNPKHHNPDHVYFPNSTNPNLIVHPNPEGCIRDHPPEGTWSQSMLSELVHSRNWHIRIGVVWDKCIREIDVVSIVLTNSGGIRQNEAKKYKNEFFESFETWFDKFLKKRFEPMINKHYD